MQADEFRELLWQQGKRLYREMPWRTDTRPYYVLVSELMLQQTQVPRVLPKFQAFIGTFPDIQALADAELAEVLRLWQGLGYNRRAKYLHDTARQIVRHHNGRFPETEADLRALPGIGPNTAGAVLAYAFNQPSLFIETNIRTVYIHHFFADDFAVGDNSIRERLEQTMDREHPREFYWALMDYGSWLKANGVRNVSQSRHYKKQPPLEGSIRQVRGRIIGALAQQDGLTQQALANRVGIDMRFQSALTGLLSDGLISESAGRFYLTK